jgi:hypothetical protein
MTKLDRPREELSSSHYFLPEINTVKSDYGQFPSSLWAFNHSDMDVFVDINLPSDEALFKDMSTNCIPWEEMYGKCCFLHDFKCLHIDKQKSH